MAGQASFTPTLEDHVAGQRLWLMSYLRRPAMKWLFVVMLILVTFSMGSVLADRIGKGVPVGHGAVEWVWPLVAPAIFIGMQVVAWYRVPKTVLRMSQQQPTLLSETTWRWDDEGVVALSAAGTSNIRWPELHRYIIGSKSILLMPQERMLLIMPRRSVSDVQTSDLKESLTKFAANATAA